MTRFVFAAVVFLCCCASKPDATPLPAWPDEQTCERVGPPPTATECGTAPRVCGDDTSGVVEVGSGKLPVTACDVVFRTAWDSLPICTMVDPVDMAFTTLDVTAVSFSVRRYDGKPLPRRFRYDCVDWSLPAIKTTPTGSLRIDGGLPTPNRAPLTVSYQAPGYDVGWHFARVAGSWTASERRAFVLGWAFGADRDVFELRGVCAGTVRYDAVDFPLVNTPCPCASGRGQCYAVMWEGVP